MSTNSRIYSLLEIVGLKERILRGTEEIDQVLKYKIDFDKVNNKLTEFRDSSRAFLEKSLNNCKQ